MDKCSSTQERFSFRVLYRFVFMLHYRPPQEKLAGVFCGIFFILFCGTMGFFTLLPTERKIISNPLPNTSPSYPTVVIRHLSVFVTPDIRYRESILLFFGWILANPYRSSIF